MDEYLAIIGTYDANLKCGKIYRESNTKTLWGRALRARLLFLGESMKGFAAFRDAIGARESSDRYDCVNQFGFLGRYQFGLARLTDLGLCKRDSLGFVWVPPLTREAFLADHALQDDVFRRHVTRLMGPIEAYHGEALGTTVDGVLVTMSGCVAVCHLLGLGGLNDFLAGRNSSDALGTSARDYMKLFTGYDLTDAALTQTA